MSRFLSNEEIAKRSAETTRIEMEKLNKVLHENSNKILKKKIKEESDSDYSLSESETEKEPVRKEYYTRSKDNNIEKVKQRYETELKELETKHHYTMLDLSNALVEVENYKHKLSIYEKDNQKLENYIKMAKQVTEYSMINFEEIFEKCVTEKQVNMLELEITNDLRNLKFEYVDNSADIENISNQFLKDFAMNYLNNIEEMLLKTDVNFKYNLDKQYGKIHMKWFYYLFGILLSILFSIGLFYIKFI